MARMGQHRSGGADLKAGAVGLPGVLMQAITHIGPALGLIAGVQFTVSLAGVTAPLVYLVALMVVLLTGISVTQLGKHFPSAGGSNTYVSRTVSPRSTSRKEDEPLVRGESVFDALKPHGIGYVHFVRYPYARTAIVSVGGPKGEALEGVYGILTSDEVAELTEPFFELTTPPGSQIKDSALAVGRVRPIAEPVAAFAATTQELARDAADLVEVEYEPLDVLVDACRTLNERRRTPSHETRGD